MRKYKTVVKGRYWSNDQRTSARGWSRPHWKVLYKEESQPRVYDQSTENGMKNREDFWS